MVKKIVMLLSALLMFSCTNTTPGRVDETKEDQISRLLKEADKKKEEMIKVEETIVEDNVVNNNEEVMEEKTMEEPPVQNKRSHKGMTRGEIMEYEMTRVSEEMNSLQADVQQYQEKKAQLKAYQEKLERLEKLNNAGLR